jgi:Predicted membrane protein
MQFFHDLNLTILTLFFVAIAITITEALPLKIGDNILIPVLAGMVMIGGHAGGNTPHIWLFLLPILGALVYSFKMLDLFGTAIAMFFGLLVLLSATQQFLVVLMCFLVLGFLISRFKYKEKKNWSGGSQLCKRGINPVIASGIMSTFSALLYTIEPRLSIFLFSGAISTALANVFATEIGVLQKNPRILFKFEKVKAGTRGAVSLLGEVGGIVGALLMGSTMAYLFSDYRLVFVSLVAGFFGCNVDSIMGSYVPNITKSEVSVFATLFGGLFALIFY